MLKIGEMESGNGMYDAEERESIIISSDVDDCWGVYTRQRKIINKLQKLGYKPFNVELQDGKIVACEFTLDLGKITFKKAIVNKRVYTDEERASLVERFKK